MIIDRKEEILFNDGVWYAIQFLVVDYDEPTYARSLVRDLKLSKQEMRSITIAQNYGTSPLQCCNLTTIPKGCIKQIADIDTIEIKD